MWSQLPLYFPNYCPFNLFCSHHRLLSAFQKHWDRSCLWASVLAASSAWHTVPVRLIAHSLPSSSVRTFTASLPTTHSLLHCSPQCTSSVPNSVQQRPFHTLQLLPVLFTVSWKDWNLHETRKLNYFVHGCIFLHSEQCLLGSQHSTNICWMNKQRTLSTPGNCPFISFAHCFYWAGDAFLLTCRSFF